MKRRRREIWWVMKRRRWEIKVGYEKKMGNLCGL